MTNQADKVPEVYLNCPTYGSVSRAAMKHDCVDFLTKDGQDKRDHFMFCGTKFIRQTEQPMADKVPIYISREARQTAIFLYRPPIMNQ